MSTKKLSVRLALGAIVAVSAAATSLSGSEARASSGEGGDSSGQIDVTVTVENLAPADGTWITPMWVGFHDGSFDTYDLDEGASEELERIAEDGNTVPLADAFLASGAGVVEGTIASSTGIPPIAPGETGEMTFTLDTRDRGSRYFSFASMVLPSNDAFIANEHPRAYRVLRGRRFRNVNIVVYGSHVRDAGSELNDENPDNTAFFGQMMPDTGLDESVGVHGHVGYKFAGSGGILDDPMFMNADFTARRYPIARIRIRRAH